jgi:hypothetical protein
MIFAFLPGAIAQTKPASIEARLRHIEDVEAIRTVLLDYGRFLDARDFASYSGLFAQDGEWAGGFGTVQGPAAIKTFMEKNMAGPNADHNYHLLSNFEVDVHGDTATAWSRWAFVAPGPDHKPVISQGGRYDDTFVRENGTWKFKRRTVSRDLPPPNPAPAK